VGSTVGEESRAGSALGRNVGSLGINGAEEVIELGAFIGDHTIYMAKRSRKVWSFECYKESYDLLTENISLNKCSNVVAPFLARGDKVGLLRESGKEGDYIPAVQELNASGRTFVYDGDGGTIPVSTLDTIFFDWIDRVDLVVIDAEGMDYKILRGAENLIRKHKPTIVFEFNGYACYPATIEEYIEYLQGFGYTVKQIGHWNWIAEVQ
jgi:FkbM family methyltransferase